MTEPLRTDLSSGTDRALHPGQHNEVNQRVISLEDTVGGLAGTVSDIDGTVGTLTTDVGTLSGTVGTLEGTVGGLDAADVGAQPADPDLAAIAALAPPDNDLIQRKAGAWTNRTPAQVAADMGLGGGGAASFVSVYKYGVDF